MSVSTVITDAGFDLLRAAPGHALIYTRAVCGSGHVDTTQLAALTEISGYVMDLSIMEVKPTSSAATLRLQLDNSRAPREFQLYQIGVCAKLMDGDVEIMGETLLQVMQYDKPDIVRAVPHISEFVVNTLMGQADKVEGVIDLAAYVSLRQFQTLAEQMDTVLERIDSLTREIMLGAISTPLAAADGKVLLTSGDESVRAVFNIANSGNMMAAVTQQIQEAKQQAAADAAAQISKTRSDLTAAISVQIAAHNTVPTAHPSHLAVVTKA